VPTAEVNVDAARNALCGGMFRASVREIVKPLPSNRVVDYGFGIISPEIRLDLIHIFSSSDGFLNALYF
jgi:hypothetical protein